jgi:MazG family protein
MSDVYVPEKLPLAQQRGEGFASLVRVMQRLLAPDGCPWDREQSYESLRGYVLEEACEVMDAIDSGELDDVCEELGDLALQVAFLSELGRRDAAFGPDDVMRGICEKLVRRHPHVFGDATAADADAVARNWEQIKSEEKKDRPLLGGIPRSLPALARAARVSKKVATVGFDWPDGRGSRAKVDEELRELDEAIAAGEPNEIQSELGDTLFALVNLARHHGVDAEAALRETGDRFVARFGHVERRVRETRGEWPKGADGKPTRGVGLDELDGYWEEAKENERDDRR